MKYTNANFEGNTKQILDKTLPEAQRTQGIESITWVNLSTRIVSNWFQWNFLNWLQICLATRWHHLHWLPILPPDAPLAYWFQIWPPNGANLISCKGAGLFQRAGQTMKQAGAKGTSRYLIGIKSWPELISNWILMRIIFFAIWLAIYGEKWP